ncbi:MAG: ABC transporter substrate-binding protein [Bacillota bacterium]
MYKMKRTLLMVLAVVLALAFVLTGCGTAQKVDVQPEDKTESSTPAKSEPAKETTMASEEPTELVWYLVGPGQEPDTDAVLAEVNKYLKDKLNVTIKLNVLAYGDAYNQKVNNMLAAGEPFDICFTAGWAADIKLNSSKGFFTELDPYLEQDPTILNIIGKDFMEGVKINGKTYAVPCNKELAHCWGFLLKKDLVDKYNIPLNEIKKMEDLEPWFEQIKNNEPGVIPLLSVEMEAPFKLLDWDNFADDDAPGALYPNNDSTTVVNQFLAPESITHYKKMREYMKKGYLAADAATMGNFNDQLKTGKYFACVQSLKPGKDAEMKGSTGGIEWVQVEITPVITSNRDCGGGALLAIPSASKNKDLAWKFINMLYTDKTLVNMFVYGIENVHYKKISDNVVTLLDSPVQYRAGNGWRFGDQLKNYLMDNEDPQKWEKFAEFNKKAIGLNSLGFTFDRTNVEAEMAACKQVVQTYYKQLFTGSVEIDPTVKQMEEELKAAKVDKVLAEMQAQYDEFLKNK